MIKVKDIREPPSGKDGIRIYVGREWPRGVKRTKVQPFEWRLDLAPSEELYQWLGRDPRKYLRFRTRYRTELLHHVNELAELVIEAEKGTVTLLCSSRDAHQCDSSVLKELLDEVLY